MCPVGERNGTDDAILLIAFDVFSGFFEHGAGGAGDVFHIVAFRFPFQKLAGVEFGGVCSYEEFWCHFLAPLNVVGGEVEAWNGESFKIQIFERQYSYMLKKGFP